MSSDNRNDPAAHGDTMEASNEKKRSLNETAVDDKKQNGEDNHNSSSSPSNDKNNNNAKRPKKENGKSQQRRKRGFDEERNDRDLPPHEGSYANKAHRELFGVTNLDENRFQYPEDAKPVKRKVALLLGFLGSEYGGFQVNVGQRTLQGELELALYRSALLSTMNFGTPHKYSWSNSARTDKGVHACAQVCSLKIEVLESEVEDSFKAVQERLQERLPSDIQVMDIVRTTRSFCAHTQRDRVRYQYMIPSFLLHPSYRQLLLDHDIPLDGRKDVARSPLRPEEVKKLQASLKEYRSTEEQRKVLKDALEKYVGTHPFHNFTRGLKVGQAQANRFIHSFVVQDSVVTSGVEWIPTQVLGDSFLLHQIRKMVSLAIDVARGVASLDVMDKALSKDVVCVSLAPAQGLFLETSYFGGYNRRKAISNPDFPDIDFSAEGPTHDRWEAFRAKIREHIVEEEASQGNFVQYLYQQECMFDHEDLYRLDRDDETETKEQ